ncbi:hypothetical protein M0R45_030818 [Rubus argutus]|uniref:Pentatricopeptide repeat-containing protein n=1 Tax=Rubus argutus TaxID=59490 RepID=A0AAW1WCG8_RUBAR
MIGGLAKVGELGNARCLFDKMLQRDAVSWNSIFDGYVKAGKMDEAFELFERMPQRNVVSWSTLVSGAFKEAIMLYDQMEKVGLKPDSRAIISILAVCAKSGLIASGKKVHASIESISFKCSTLVSNALLDMYAKCGGLDEEYKVFDGIAKKYLVSWNSMLQGLAMHGHGEKAPALL